MTAESLTESLRAKAGLIAAHGQDVVRTGAETLKAAGEVVAGARRDAAQVLERTRDELKKTLVDGASRVGQKLSRIAMPTRKEQAQARKSEIKAKKRRKRAAPAAGDDASGQPAPPA